MRIWITCILVLLFFVSGNTQSEINPFDIRVDRIEDNIPNKIKDGNNKIISDPKLKESDNPFEISHIPIRKSQIKKSDIKKSKKLKTSASSSEYLLPLIIVLISLLMIGFLLMRQRGTIQSVLKALNNRNYAKTFYREQNDGQSLELVIFFVVFVLNLALFIKQSVQLYLGQSQINIFMLILGVFLLYLGRHLFMNLFSWIFPVSEGAKPYNFGILLANTLIGVCLIPMNLLLAYGPKMVHFPAIILGLLIIGVFFGLRYIRGFVASQKIRSQSIFHFFLYFCTIEILPFVLGFKFITSSV